MRTLIPLVAGGIAAALATSGLGCILQDPSYEGTAFSCASPDELCPSGYACVDGVCVAPADDPGDPGGTPDAGTDPVGDPPDAGTDPNPPDAAPEPEPVTLTFGERPTADVTGVTTDASLIADTPNANDGGDDIFRIDADPLEYAVLRFDVSAIPVGATVVSAQLDLYTTNPIEEGVYELYPVLEDWDEDEVTYRSRRNNQRWTMEGASAPASALALMASTLAPRAEGPVRAEVSRAVVQGWVTNPSSNFGLVWRALSIDRGGNFSSSETGTPAQAPLLTVTYIP